MVFIKPHLHLWKLFLYSIQLDLIQVSYPVWVCHHFPWQDLGAHSPLWGVIVILLPRWHSGKECTCQCRTCKRHVFKSPGWGRSSGVGNTNPHQHSCLENSMDKIPCSLGSSPQGHKESDTTKWQNTYMFILLSWRLLSSLEPRVFVPGEGEIKTQPDYKRTLRKEKQQKQAQSLALSHIIITLCMYIWNKKDNENDYLNKINSP